MEKEIDCQNKIDEPRREEVIDRVLFYLKLDDKAFHGRVVCLDKANNCVAMIETAWDRYLMKIFDMTKIEDRNEVRRTLAADHTAEDPWILLESSKGVNDKWWIRETISALNYTKSEDNESLINRITDIARPQWERNPYEPIPTPIPHPDVNGVEGPPKPKGAIR